MVDIRMHFVVTTGFFFIVKTKFTHALLFSPGVATEFSHQNVVRLKQERHTVLVVANSTHTYSYIIAIFLKDCKQYYTNKILTTEGIKLCTFFNKRGKIIYQCYHSLLLSIVQ